MRCRVTWTGGLPRIMDFARVGSLAYEWRNSACDDDHADIAPANSSGTGDPPDGIRRKTVYRIGRPAMINSHHDTDRGNGITASVGTGLMRTLRRGHRRKTRGISEVAAVYEHIAARALGPARETLRSIIQ
jgi:hypothetical protein